MSGGACRRVFGGHRVLVDGLPHGQQPPSPDAEEPWTRLPGCASPMIDRWLPWDDARNQALEKLHRRRGSFWPFTRERSPGAGAVPCGNANESPGRSAPFREAGETAECVRLLPACSTECKGSVPVAVIGAHRMRTSPPSAASRLYCAAALPVCSDWEEKVKIHGCFQWWWCNSGWAGPRLECQALSEVGP